jgi:transcriptional regulator with XRE-family HTH domain
MDVRKLVGQNFKRLREQRGITQKDAASALGIAATQLYSFEAGKAGFTADSIAKYCSFLGVAPIELFYMEQSDAPVPQGFAERFIEMQVLLAEKIAELRQIKNSFSEDELLQLRVLKTKVPKNFFDGLLRLREIDFKVIQETFPYAFSEELASAGSSKSLDTKRKK